MQFGASYNHHAVPLAPHFCKEYHHDAYFMIQKSNKGSLKRVRALLGMWWVLHRFPLLLSCTVALPCQADLGFHLSKDDLMKDAQSPVGTGKWKTRGAKAQPRFCALRTHQFKGWGERSAAGRGVSQMRWRWAGPRASCPWCAPMFVMRPRQLAQCFQINLLSSLPFSPPPFFLKKTKCLGSL